MTPRSFLKSDGFSTLEVVAVLVLLSILSLILATYYQRSDTDRIAQNQILKTHIRYAQARAMNTNDSWGIHYEVDGDRREYWLFKYPETNQKIALPGQTADSVDLKKMDLAIKGSKFSLTFDSWGRPNSEERPFTDGQLTLKLNRTGTEDDDTTTITIIENTGFIP